MTVRSTYTDNVTLAPDAEKQSSLVFELAPSIRIEGNTARAKLSLFYQLDGVIDTRDSSRNDVHHDLAANGTLTAIEDFLFVDLNATIAQQVVSPLGARPPSDVNFTPNRVESRAFQVAPYVRGHLPFGADYTARFSETILRTQAGFDDSRIHDFNARIAGDPSYGHLNWALEAIAQKTDFKVGRDTDDERARAVLTYAVDPELQVSATGGVERTNMATLEHDQKATYGAGFEWNPERRTRLNGQWERRFFGDGWQYGLQHRMPRVVISFNGSRDVSTDAQRLLTSGAGVAYDLLYNSLASRFPDPAERAVETRRLLDTGGIPADLNLPPDFLIGGVFVDRRLQASLAATGVRNTAAVSVYRSHREQLGGFSSVIGTSGGPANISEYGATGAFSHRLTAISSLTALASARKTKDLTASGQSSRQWEARLLYSTKLGIYTSGTLELRHVQFDSDTAAGDYRENAITATVLVQF